MSLLRRAVPVLLLSSLVACTEAPPSGAGTVSPPRATPSTPSPSPSPPSSASPASPAFSAARALTLVEQLVALGPRETTTRAYRRASALVAEQLRALGYRVRFQRFDVPGGSVDGTVVEAGDTRNVIAEPPGFDPARAHLVVGAHLDTVPDSPGANDNASGVATLVELARLAAADPPRTPVVFVAFGAEERRRQSPSRSRIFLGARAYLDGLDAPARAGLRGMINLDMVGNGREVLVLGGQGPVQAALLAAARRLDVPARPSSVDDRFSDHQAFREAGYPVGWLWAGDHSTLHTPRDTLEVVQRAMLRRVGRIAWEALRRLRFS